MKLAIFLFLIFASCIVLAEIEEKTEEQIAGEMLLDLLTSRGEYLESKLNNIKTFRVMDSKGEYVEDPVLSY
ncbi:unnamed protein product [Caenorhabditis brenneri]